MLLGLREHPRRPFVAVLGGRQGERQARRHRRAARRSSTRSSSAAACASRSSPRRASRSATRCCEPDQVDDLPAAARRVGQADPPAGATSSALDAGGDVRHLGTRLPDGCEGPRHRARHRAAAFADVILDAGTVFWNGPMGMFEDPRFAAGTRTVAAGDGRHQGLHRRRRRRLGGRAGRSSASPTEVDHVSTGGGASLELLELGDLPGLAALREAPNAHG